MTDDIRAELRKRLAEQNISQAELARRTGRTRHAINRVLNDAELGGKVPPILADILDVLGLKLEVVPKDEA